MLTTEKHRGTSKYVFSRLTAMGLRPRRGEPPLATLEVGAVNTQLSAVPWLAVRAIDLRSTHPRIEEADFFALRPEGSFAVCVCAMVLNCCPDARDRGAMLWGLRRHLAPGGVAFLVIPLRCLHASRHATQSIFDAALRAAGLHAVHTRASPKCAFFTCVTAEQMKPATAAAAFPYPPRVVGGAASATNDFGVSFDDPRCCSGDDAPDKLTVVNVVNEREEEGGGGAPAAEEDHNDEDEPPLARGGATRRRKKRSAEEPTKSRTPPKKRQRKTPALVELPGGAK